MDIYEFMRKIYFLIRHCECVDFANVVFNVDYDMRQIVIKISGFNMEEDLYE